MNNIDHSADTIYLKVNIPDKGIFEKTFSFNHDEKVWAAKERVIHEVGKESKDIQNYGFFVPPCQGKAGKFMDEGRPLSEYSLPGNHHNLEFMLKRRVYRSISFDENKLTKIHTKGNLKKLMELVEQNNAGQVNQFLEKGLDPNFQDPKTGETPLTTAAVMENAPEVIMFLVNGGAYLDFRNRNGLTAVHKAAAMGKGHNIKAFLDLGASPNYRDLKGLTPLYHACFPGGNSHVAELLLSDQADIGVVDSQGWQEIHQVCRYGHLQHLEQLIFYGADLNAQNGSGNSPLHICALYNQEECSRLLLYRGATRDIVNFANQTAEVVAVVATNAKLSEFIRNYSEKDVVPYIDKPTYSTRRRTAQSKTRPTANSVFLRDSTDTFIFCSETLSTTSSDTSEPMSLDLSPRDIVPTVQVAVTKSPSRKCKRSRTMSRSGSDSSYATDSGDETGGSSMTSPLNSPTSDEQTLRWRTYSLSSLNKEERGTVPRVKEVKGAANMTPSTTGKNHSRKGHVAVKDFTPTQAGELSLTQGDIVEVVTKGEKGYWQGSVNGNTGWFPAECVDELKKRKTKTKNAMHKPPSVASLNKSTSSLDQPYTPVVTTPQPRQIILQKVKAGFGFQMRGANASANKLEFSLSTKIPALQYVGEVEAGGEADKQGVKKGDYILEVNGTDVKTATHRNVVSLIRKTGPNLIMKIISIENSEHPNKAGKSDARNNSPAKTQRPENVPVERVPPVVNGTAGGSVDAIRDNREKKPPPAIPSRAPTTSLTSRPKSIRQSIADVDFEKPQSIQEDRIISVPRERISPSDTQWQSPLSGHHSLPRRPKSSYGAIIGTSHDSGDTTKKNYHALASFDDTVFTTLPSRPPNAPRVASQDDSAVSRKREGSWSKNRPKSWMPKVLPTGVQATTGTAPAHVMLKVSWSNPPTDGERVEERQETPKVSELKKDKKRRFSFKKKKEKEYAVAAPETTPAEEPGTENGVDDVMTGENLHIEDEQTRPHSLPGLHKRLSTFKPMTAHSRHVFEYEGVSPELSQALLKRKSRVLSDPTHGNMSPASPPLGHEPPPPPLSPPPPADRPKTLEDSIKEEMMRRRSNTVPSKPRRTFEYNRNSDDPLMSEQQGVDLDAELAKAVAKRAAKLSTSESDDGAHHIYMNINPAPVTNPPDRIPEPVTNPPDRIPEPKTIVGVQEPAAFSIDETLKKHHFHDEVHFKTPIQPPVGKKPSNGVTPGKKPPVKAPLGKVPPKTLPKPKRKPSSSTSGDATQGTPPRPVLTLPLSTEQQTTFLPPPILSPEMVATQLLDDIINEEVKRCNWDTASWLDKDISSPKSSTSSIEPSTPPLHDTPDTPPYVVASSPDDPATSPQPGTGKKKYIYKITMVTEKPSDGPPIEHAPIVTQIVMSESPSNEAHPVSLNDSELPPPPPPLEFNDDIPSSFPPPIFTPPSSPISNDVPDGVKTNYVDQRETTPPSSEIPPPVLAQEPPPSLPQEPPPSLPQEPPPVVYKKLPHVSQKPPPPPQEPPPPPQEPPPPPQEPPPPSQEPPPPPQEPPPPSQESPPPPQEPPPPPQEPPPPPQEPPPPSQEPPPPPQESPPPSQESPPPPQEPAPPQELPPPPQESTPPPQELPPPPQELPPPPQELPPPPQEPPPQELPPPPQEPPSQESPLPPQEFPPITPPEPSSFPSPPPHEPPPPEESPNMIFSSPLPPPVMPPPPAEGVNGEVGVGVRDATVAPPEQYKKEESVKDIVGMPAVFADGEVVPEASRTCEGQSETAEGVVDSRPCPEKVETVVSNGDENPDVSARDTTDHNENLLEPPAMYSGPSEELAPSEPVLAEDSTDSSSFQELPYEKWTFVHVCQWLDSIGMAEHKELFQENDIRGPNLLGLTKEDLRELGVKKLGHRMTISDEINTLTTNRGAATNL